MVHTVEHGGLLWKPLPHAASTAEEFQRARSLMIQLHEESSWNPWVMEDQADDYAEATDIFSQWTRAEPGHRYLTEVELDAKRARSDAEFKQRSAEQEAQRLSRIPASMIAVKKPGSLYWSAKRSCVTEKTACA